jgi:hypothetical protein
MASSDPGEQPKIWLEDGFYEPDAIVRAILTEMREPSEGIVSHGAFVADDGCDGPTTWEVERAFVGMIDSILEGKA